MLRSQRAVRHVAAMALAGAMTVPAAAGFQNVGVEYHATVTTADGPRDVYRLYAYFTQESDRLVQWGGSQAQPAHIFSGPCTGSAFYQAPAGGNTAPLQAFINILPDTQWDTFATIGVSIADQGVPSDQTLLTPNFPTFISGDEIMLSDAAVFTPLDAAQNRADFAGDGDPQLRVLMAQLTVMPGEYPYGSVGTLTWRNDSGQSFQMTNQSWIGLAAHGRCCIPDGTCAVMYHSACAQFANGHFINCDPCEECAGTCVPDVAPHPGDGEVNIDDLLAVVGGWGPCPPFDLCPPDVSPPPSGNNVVDIDDLLAVISAWGPCK